MLKVRYDFSRRHFRVVQRQHFMQETTGLPERGVSVEGIQRKDDSVSR
jgi:hypothetical protein